MGKIVAIGGGCPNERGNRLINKTIVELCGRQNAKVLYLPTAGFDNDDDFDEIKQRFAAFGCVTDELLLTDETLTDEYIKTAILSSDIVYVGGGNLKFLMDTWKARKADVYLREAYENGTVLSGTSSGAMCWFQRGYDDCGENHEYIFVDCLNLLPYCNCPHFENKNWRKFKNRVKEQDLPGIAVENGAAFIECDGKKYVLHAKKNRSAYYLDASNSFKMLNLRFHKVFNKS